jgi:saccharopine dehydrogenase (NAD+, L-lysine-forming)
MTFGKEYLTHLRVLQNVGMTRIDPVDFQGRPVIPLEFLKAVLPEPASLGANYTGKTNIGVMMDGIKGGQKKRYYVYNVCDHAACYAEVNAQAVSYTTGVPAMIGAMLVLTGAWSGKGVFNVEQFDPDPFMEALPVHGLPWQEQVDGP